VASAAGRLTPVRRLGEEIAAAWAGRSPAFPGRAANCPAGPLRNAAHSDLSGTSARSWPAGTTGIGPCCSTAADNRCSRASAPSRARLPAPFLAGKPTQEPWRQGAIKPRSAAPGPAAPFGSGLARVCQARLSSPSPCMAYQLAMAQVPWPDLDHVSRQYRHSWARLAGGGAPRPAATAPGLPEEDRRRSTSRSLERPVRHGLGGAGLPRSNRAAALELCCRARAPWAGPTGSGRIRAFPAGRPQPACSRARRQWQGARLKLAASRGSFPSSSRLAQGGRQARGGARAVELAERRRRSAATTHDRTIRGQGKAPATSEGLAKVPLIQGLTPPGHGPGRATGSEHPKGVGLIQQQQSPVVLAGPAMTATQDSSPPWLNRLSVARVTAACGSSRRCVAAGPQARRCRCAAKRRNLAPLARTPTRANGGIKRSASTRLGGAISQGRFNCRQIGLKVVGTQNRFPTEPRPQPLFQGGVENLGRLRWIKAWTLRPRCP